MIGRRVFVYSGWLIVDRIARMIVGLFVWASLARHAGPEIFGLWSYALALSALCGSFAGLGLDGVVVRELIKDPSRSGLVLGTAATLRFGSSLASLVVAIVAVAVLRPGEHFVYALVALHAGVIVLQSPQVVDFYFQSRMNARPVVVATSLAFMLSSMGRVVLIWSGLSILWLGMSLLIEAAVATGLLIYAYRKDVRRNWDWSLSLSFTRHLMRESWPLLASSMAVMIYMRVDQVMLSSLSGDTELGQFSAALRLSEAWYFVPMAVVTAAFPVMMSERERGALAYANYMQTLFDGLGWLAVTIAVVASIAAPWLVLIVYGDRFIDSVSVLRVQIWAGVPVALSLAHGKWLLAEGLQRYGLVSTAAGALVNVCLNLWMIPRYGAIGAAVATLLTQGLQVLMPLLFPATRLSGIRMLGFVFAPARRMAPRFG